MKALIILGFCLGLFGACNPCKPGVQRCNGNVVEICRPDRKWSKVINCDSVLRTSKKFKCCCVQLPNGKKPCTCKIEGK